MSSVPPTEGTKPFVRVTSRKDGEAIVDVLCHAFSNDPAFNYYGQLKKVIDEKVDIAESRGKRTFTWFLLRTCFLLGGRVNVVVDPAKEGKIVAAALWLPPGKRIAPWMLVMLFRAGFIGVLLKWGIQGFTRTVIDFLGTADEKMHQAFEEKGIKTHVDDTWYLQLVGTEPEYQDQGLMSLLVRDAFAHAPDHMYTLEATTTASRDKYAHLGFEVFTPIKFGRGKADAQGLAASGDKATGLELHGMAIYKENIPKIIAAHSQDSD